MSYPKGEWTESCLDIRTVIKKRWFWLGYKVVNEVKYEVLRSNGLNGISGRVETVWELPVNVKTKKEADDLKQFRDKFDRTAKKVLDQG